MKFTGLPSISLPGSGLLAILVTSLLPAVNAVCKSGEVGVGVTEVYQWQGTNNVLAAQNPGIYANNCGSIAFSDAGLQTNPCKGNYGNGNGVQCDSNGNPDFVWTVGGNFHNCYRISNGQCATGPFTYINVYWCCERW